MNPHDGHPERDGLHSPDGVWWPSSLPANRAPMPAHVNRHEHRLRDGTLVEVVSQRIDTVDLTLDRWFVGAYQFAVTHRLTPHTDPPDYAWVEQRASMAA